MTKITFKVDKRSNKKAKQLRREGRLPANVYIPKKDSIALELDPIDFAKLWLNLFKHWRRISSRTSLN